VKRWTRRQILDWEGKWSLPVGLATFAVVILMIASAVVIGSVSGEGEAELLRKAHEHSSDVTLSAVLSALSFVLMAAPLYFLFRAASARTDRMRRQLVGLVVAAPLFLAVAGVLSATATNEASDQFEAGQAKSTLTAKEAETECRADLNDEGSKDFNEKYDEGKTPAEDCADTKVADDEAENALSDAGVRGISTILLLAGRLGLAIALIYTCLYAMRTGLLTRFWGSLGMALGVAALLLIVQFTAIFFLYFALLLIGKLPGGRPPAWAAGEAVPWPTPGEKMAAEMEPPDPDAIDVDAVEEDEEPPPPSGNGSGGSSSRKKRKRRD
jgi:hypothetical protein